MSLFWNITWSGRSFHILGKTYEAPKFPLSELDLPRVFSKGFKQSIVRDDSNKILNDSTPLALNQNDFYACSNGLFAL